jgi:hypothetical protein
MYAFWCSNDQTVAQGETMLTLTGSLTEYNLGMNRALAMVPNGGTCPGLAMEQATQLIEMSNPRGFPYVSSLIMTDGAC